MSVIKTTHYYCCILSVELPQATDGQVVLYVSELELYFGSATAAAAAAENLCKMRDGIEVDYGQPLPVVDTAAAGKC